MIPPSSFLSLFLRSLDLLLDLLALFLSLDLDLRLDLSSLPLPLSLLPLRFLLSLLLLLFLSLPLSPPRPRVSSLPELREFSWSAPFLVPPSPPPWIEGLGGTEGL